METKSIFASKTAIANLLIPLAALYPPVGAFVAAHPQETLALLGIFNIGLRLVTKKKVQLWKE